MKLLAVLHCKACTGQLQVQLQLVALSCTMFKNMASILFRIGVALPPCCSSICNQNNNWLILVLRPCSQAETKVKS